MFILTTLSDLIQISPEDFRKPSIVALEDNINAKYANKVIQKIGLCICMYDLLKASDGLVGHGKGTANVNVEFRLVVFRPFKGEIIQGIISSSSHQGLQIRLDFFDDIFIPGHLLFPDTTFNAAEQTWVWENDGSQLYFDVKETVRFRVESEEWNDQSPVAPSITHAGVPSERKSPYAIQGSMSQAGLGLVSWW